MNTDVQSRTSERSYKLSRVGVKGLKKPIHVKRKDKVTTLMPVIDVSVDLPAHLKGSHMSRNIEVVSHIIDESVKEPVKSIENLCETIVRELMKKHEYASFASASLISDYFREVELFSGKKSIEFYKIIGESTMEREPEKIRNTIGVEVIGMNACPCAMEGVKKILTEENISNVSLPSDYPFITHNQRNITRVSVETSNNYFMEAEMLIDIVEDSVSSPTFEYLKREDEARLVINAHKKPRFVEDIVRDILYGIINRCPDIPDDAIIKITSESEESIHKHNAFAERITSVGELRK